MSPVFEYDATNVKPDSGREALPRGIYNLEITSAVAGYTKETNRPKVTVDFRVIDSLQFAGRKVRYHTVVFIPEGEKGAGMALHFLKTIGEPFEGKLKVNTDSWIGKKLKATVDIDEKGYNKVTNVMPYDYTEALDAPKTGDGSDIPF